MKPFNDSCSEKQVGAFFASRLCLTIIVLVLVVALSVGFILVSNKTIQNEFRKACAQTTVAPDGLVVLHEQNGSFSVKEVFLDPTTVSSIEQETSLGTTYTKIYTTGQNVIWALESYDAVLNLLYQ